MSACHSDFDFDDVTAESRSARTRNRSDMCVYEERCFMSCEGMLDKSWQNRVMTMRWNIYNQERSWNIYDISLVLR